NDARTTGPKKCLSRGVWVLDLPDDIPAEWHVPEIGIQKIQDVFPFDSLINELNHFPVHLGRCPTLRQDGKGGPPLGDNAMGHVPDILVGEGLENLWRHEIEHGTE